MNRVQHISNNDVFGAPAGHDQGGLPVSALPVTRVSLDGRPAIVSYWRPNAEELADLNAGANVALWVLGSQMPAVAVLVDPA